MENLDVFVMPSFSEGTPTSIVEAMAAANRLLLQRWVERYDWRRCGR
jgi:glycosyltransferase involved in cell wall biosynthesis